MSDYIVVSLLGLMLLIGLLLGILVAAAVAAHWPGNKS